MALDKEMLADFFQQQFPDVDPKYIQWAIDCIDRQTHGTATNESIVLIVEEIVKQTKNGQWESNMVKNMIRHKHAPPEEQQRLQDFIGTLQMDAVKSGVVPKDEEIINNYNKRFGSKDNGTI